MIWGILFIIALIYLAVWAFATAGAFNAITGFCMVYAVMFLIYLDVKNKLH